MLEFAKVPGLTKIFNRDDWQKVFIACSELPDYRESKYSDYFITTDATVRAGKLYYAKNALEKGGYSFDPISHIQLVNENEGPTPEVNSYCFGPGEKFEFKGFQLDAKYVAGERNITADPIFAAGTDYYIKEGNSTVRLRGFTGITLIDGSFMSYVKRTESGTDYYYFKLGWLNTRAAYLSAKDGKNAALNTIYKANYNSDGSVASFMQLTNSTTPKKPDTSDDTKYTTSIEALTEATGEINIWVRHTQAEFNAFEKYFYNAGRDKTTKFDCVVYDKEVIGNMGPDPSSDYYMRVITGVTPTEDPTFVAGKHYLGWDGAYLYSIMEGDTEDDTTYIAGSNIANWCDTHGYESVTDAVSPRMYKFVKVDVSTITNWSSSNLAAYGNAIYRWDTGTDMYTINLDRGTASRVTYLATGERIADTQMQKHSDLKFRKSHSYYIVKEGTDMWEPGYQILDPSRYTNGRTISDWEEEFGLTVYQFSNPFWVPDMSFVGSNTHGKPWYERAGINYPYEGFVAVTTARSDDAARGSLLTCKRKTYEITEDMIHGYTGDGANAVSKPYYEYDSVTNKYTQVPTQAKPMFRRIGGSSFIDTTEEEFFSNDRPYYADINANVLLIKGTEEDVAAGIADYYPGMRVDACAKTSYDRHRQLYWRTVDRMSGDGTWTFNPISTAYGLTTDTEWELNPDGTPNLGKYWFYTGSAYTFKGVNKAFSVVQDSVFGYKDLSTSYYGYESIDVEETIKSEEGGVKTYYTVEEFRTKYISEKDRVDVDYGEVVREHITPSGRELHYTVPLSGSTSMVTTDGTTNYIYHIRRYSFGSNTIVSGKRASSYCPMEGNVISADNISYDSELLGHVLPSKMYMKYGDDMPTYFYMKDPSNLTWSNKFAEFSLEFNPILTTDTAIDPSKRYYTGTVEYTRATGGKWDANMPYYRKNVATGEYVLASNPTGKPPTETASGPSSAETPYYIPAGIVYEETLPISNPSAEGLYEYTDSYLGRLISSQSKIIYCEGTNGTVPTECLVYTEYSPDNIDTVGKKAGADYGDGEEITDNPPIFVVSKVGEAILPDEYYEECFGLYHWEQFFLDRGVSATKVDNVTVFLVDNDSNVKLYATWGDPEVMIKKDQPTSTPDAWNRTSVVLHHGDEKVVLFINRDHSAFEKDPLIIDTASNDLCKLYCQQALGTSTVNAVNRAKFVTALKEGYISFVAVSATERTSTYSVFPSQVEWTDREGKVFIDVHTGEVLTTTNVAGACSASFTATGGVGNKAVPTVKYYVNDSTTTTPHYVVDEDVFDGITTVESKHVRLFDYNTPIFKIKVSNGVGDKLRDVLEIMPVVVGVDGGYNEGTVIEQPESVGDVETHYCVYTHSKPVITLNEIVRKGRAKDVFELGSVLTVPYMSSSTSSGGDDSDYDEGVVDPGTRGNSKVTSPDEAIVVDMNHVALARDFEYGYEAIHEVDEDNPPEFLYCPHALSKFETTQTTRGTNDCKMVEVHLPDGYTMDLSKDVNSFFVKNESIPHHKFYIRQFQGGLDPDDPDKKTVYDDVSRYGVKFVPIDYEQEGWKEILANPGQPVYYKVPEASAEGAYMLYEDTKYSVTLRIGEALAGNFDDNGHAQWAGSTMRAYLNELDDVSHTNLYCPHMAFFLSVREVYNVNVNRRCVFLPMVVGYEETVDSTVQSGKTYYKRINSEGVAVTYDDAGVIPAEEEGDSYVEDSLTSGAAIVKIPGQIVYFDGVTQPYETDVTAYLQTSDATVVEGKKYFRRLHGGSVVTFGSGGAVAAYDPSDTFEEWSILEPGAVIPTSTGATVYYEEMPEKTISLDKFWLPSASQIGLSGVPAPYDVLDTLSVPVEGGILDAFETVMPSKTTLIANRSWVNLNPRQFYSKSNSYKPYWLRTQPDFMIDQVAIIDELGGARVKAPVNGGGLDTNGVVLFSMG